MDPDETSHYEPSHLDLQCFSKSSIVVFGALRVNIHFLYLKRNTSWRNLAYIHRNI